MVRGGPGEQEGGGEGGRDALRGAAERLQGQVRAALDGRAPAHLTEIHPFLLKMVAMAFVYARQLSPHTHGLNPQQQIHTASSRLAPRLSLLSRLQAAAFPQGFYR